MGCTLRFTCMYLLSLSQQINQLFLTHKAAGLLVCVLPLVLSFTWRSVHCGPPGNVLSWLSLRTALPTLTPGTTAHTLSLNK